MSDRDPRDPEQRSGEPEPTRKLPDGNDPFWTDQPTREWSAEELRTVREAVGEDAPEPPSRLNDPAQEPEQRAVLEPQPLDEPAAWTAAPSEAASEPRGADAPPSRHSAPYAPRTLPKRRYATLRAFAEALLPRGGPIEDSASDAGVSERLDRAVAAFDPGARRTFTRMLRLFELGSVFSRNLRPFSRLHDDARTAYVARALRSRLQMRRGPAEFLKFYAGNAWASDARVEAQIGFTYSCVTDDPPRDGERLEVLSWPQVSQDHTEECDVVVVGSGAGGAVMAREMAELGMTVVVLEEGPYFTRTDFTGPPFERLLKLYRRQGMTIALGRPSIPVPMGMAIGGTTLVNSGTCFRTPDRVLARWEREFGLPGIDPEAMKPFFDRVERILKVKPVPEELLGPNVAMFRRGAQAMGLHGQPIRRNIDGCRGCGVCAFGCPSDAKQSTHLSYLPRAQRAGASIYANARAEQVVVEDGRARGIVAALLDPQTREPKARLTVRAKIVVLAAGAVYTPSLLHANALGNLSGNLGRHLRVHPAAGVGAFFDAAVHGWRGTLQPYYLDDWTESHETTIEVTSSIPSVGAGTFPGSGKQLKELLARYPNMASAGLFVSDTSSGRVHGRAGREPIVTYSLNRTDTERMVRGLARVSEIFLAAGARAVLTGIPSAPLVTSSAQLADAIDKVDPRFLRLTAFHPVGTARMAEDPATSVIDPWGEVHGVANLFVADASMLPGCPTVNPQVTIMAFATRTADHIARHAGRYLA